MLFRSDRLDALSSVADACCCENAQELGEEFFVPSTDIRDMRLQFLSKFLNCIAPPLAREVGWVRGDPRIGRTRCFIGERRNRAPPT